MTYDEAMGLGRHLLKEQGCDGWRLDVENLQNTFCENLAITDFNQRKIALHPEGLELSTSEINGIILHEIAHAHAGPEVGHGPKWVAAAEKLGLPVEYCWPHYFAEREDQ